MNYRIEDKAAMILTGFKKRFYGNPADMKHQDHEFAVSTRLKQYILEGLAHDCDNSYTVLTNFSPEGYDYYLAARLCESSRRDMVEEIGEEAAAWYEHIPIPAGQYLVCKTRRCQYPVDEIDDLRRQAVSEWLPTSGYELRNAPEIGVIHWYWEEGNEKLNTSRYCEIWLPITKK